jgi:uncharacterized protein YecT (DUF1311 family)
LLSPEREPLMTSTYCAGLMTVVLLVLPAAAQSERPDPADLAAVRKCIADHPGKGEVCISMTAAACIKKSEVPAVEIDCYHRERLVWDTLLNNAYREMNAKLDDEQKLKARDMQRAWIYSRNQTCGFLYDYFQGSMAYPMIAYCENEETARRAIFLLKFSN